MAGSSVSPAVDDGAATTRTGALRDPRAAAGRRGRVHLRQPGDGRAGVPGRPGELSRPALHPDPPGDHRGRHRRRLRTGAASPGGRPAPQRGRARQRHRDALPGEARRHAARRHRRRIGHQVRRDGRPDGGRPRVDRPAGDQVGDAGRRPELRPARAPPGDQDRRHRTDRTRLRVPAGGRPGCAQHRGRPQDLDAGDPGRPGARARRGGGDAAGRCRAPADHHGRRHLDVRRPGGADACRRAARRRGLGGQLVRGQHRRDAPAVPGQPRPHVRPPQRAARRPGRRGAHRRDVRLPGGLPGPGGRVLAGHPRRPRRPRRLRDRQELPGRPRHRRRPEADPGGARGRPRPTAGSGHPGGRRPPGRRAPGRPRTGRRRRCATPTSRRAGRSRSTRRSSWRPWRPACRPTRSSSTRR